MATLHYFDLFRELFKHDIRYLICGGLAVNIYGIPRMTADIDLLVDFADSNILEFERVVTRLNYQSLIPLKLDYLIDESHRVEMIRDKNLIAYSYYNSQHSFMNLDVLVDVPISFEEMWEKREVRKVDDTEVSIVSIPHLIAMKKYSNRIQDKQDVLFLSKMLENKVGEKTEIEEKAADEQ